MSSKFRIDSPATKFSPSRLPRLESHRAKSSELDELNSLGKLKISFEDDSIPIKTPTNRKMLWLDPVYKISATPPSPAFSRSYDGVPRAKFKKKASGLSLLNSPQGSSAPAELGSIRQDTWRTVEYSIKDDFTAQLQKLKDENDTAALARIEELHNVFLNRIIQEVTGSRADS
jgi:hypothetical protein